MKTGLVLEGGAFRTIFSSGACDGLMAGDIFPDYCVGVSAGIAYGVSYLSKQSGRNLEILTRYANDKRYIGKRNLLRPGNRRSYFGLEFSYSTIPNELIPFDYDTFADFPGEVEAVVTNMDTGKAEYLSVPRRDEKFELLQATCAMPFLFPIYHIGGKAYMDGGAADAIPYERAFQKGCDRVVAVLTKERDYLRKPESLQPLLERWYRKYPKFCDTMRRRADTYNESRIRLFQLEREGKAFLLAPKDTKGFSRTERDVEKIKTLYQDGYDQAVAALPQIRNYLAK